MNSPFLTLGPFELTAIDAGHFRLDGGAMFGVVPKTLWSKRIPSDELNRIPMMMRCLLVRSEATGRLYLIDNGCGTKFDEKMSAIYDLPHGLPPGEDALHKSLADAGVKPEDITDLVFSHLHFDHCGGSTAFKTQGDPDSGLRFVFPNATMHVNARHWETAIQPNKRERASFLKENIEPLRKALSEGRLRLIEDGYEFEPGFDTLIMDGHTIGQQLPRIHGVVNAAEESTADGPSDGEVHTLVFAADLIPLHQHVPLPWVMGYDMNPLQTLNEKEQFLHHAASEGWILFLEHDAHQMLIRIEEPKPGSFSAVPV